MTVRAVASCNRCGHDWSLSEDSITRLPAGWSRVISLDIQADLCRNCTAEFMEWLGIKQTDAPNKQILAE